MPLDPNAEVAKAVRRSITAFQSTIGIGDLEAAAAAAAPPGSGRASVTSSKRASVAGSKLS